MPDSSTSIVHFDFYGDDLLVVPMHGEHWVVLSRLCEPFQLKDPWEQARKLQKLPWARTVIIPVPDARGVLQDQVCLNIRSVAGWLFTLNAGKVAEHLREKLVRYQRECADALSDHLFGRRNALPSPERMADAVASRLEPRLAEQDARSARGEERLAHLEKVLLSYTEHPDRFLPRQELRDTPPTTDELRKLIRAAAKVHHVSFERVHGVLRHECGISTYLRIHFTQFDRVKGRVLGIISGELPPRYSRARPKRRDGAPLPGQRALFGEKVRGQA